jgi:replication initiation protein RepC
VRAENRAIALLRERITIIRRDIVTMIKTGREEGVRCPPFDGVTRPSRGYARLLGRAGLEALARRSCSKRTQKGQKMAQ